MSTAAKPKPAVVQAPVPGVDDGKFGSVAVSGVKVRRGRRAPENVADLADSIDRIGLLNPITITTEYLLVAGCRRLAAYKLLKRDKIPARMVSLDKLGAELAEIDENLCRAELTVLERAEQMSRRKDIYETLNPETKHGAAPGKAGGGKKAKDGIIPSFASDAAAKTGSSSSTVHKDVQIAEQIPEETKKLIRGTPLEDRKADLVKLARIKDKGEQKRVAEVVAKSAKDATKSEDDGKRAKPLTVPQAVQVVRREDKRRKMEERAAEADAAERAEESGDSDTSVTPPDPPWNIITGEVAAGDACPLLDVECDSVRLVFADPPYNIGLDYGHGHDDAQADLAYLTWVEVWVKQCADLLTPDGSMWVLINDEYAAEYATLLKKGGLFLRNWIVWYETFGVNCSDKFNRTKRHLLYSVKNPDDFVFHADAVNRPSDRQAKYNDARANPGGKILDDVWFDVPRLVGSASERIPDFTTQLPEALLRRVIACASDPGDLVLDPFNGSGTTGAAALQLGRRYLGVERNPAFADVARLRLKGVTRDVRLAGQGTEGVRVQDDPGRLQRPASGSEESDGSGAQCGAGALRADGDRGEVLQGGAGEGGEQAAGPDDSAAAQQPAQERDRQVARLSDLDGFPDAVADALLPLGITTVPTLLEHVDAKIRIDLPLRNKVVTFLVNNGVKIKPAERAADAVAKSVAAPAENVWQPGASPDSVLNRDWSKCTRCESPRELVVRTQLHSSSPVFEEMVCEACAVNIRKEKSFAGEGPLPAGEPHPDDLRVGRVTPPKAENKKRVERQEKALSDLPVIARKKPKKGAKTK